MHSSNPALAPRRKSVNEMRSDVGDIICSRFSVRVAQPACMPPASSSRSCSITCVCTCTWVRVYIRRARAHTHTHTHTQVGGSGCEGAEAEVEMNRNNVEMLAAQEGGAEIDIGDHNLELY